MGVGKVITKCEQKVILLKIKHNEHSLLYFTNILTDRGSGGGVQLIFGINWHLRLQRAV